MSNTGGANNPAGAHLMVCIALDARKDNAIVVPLVSRHDRSDASCVLNTGDHPFIQRETCAAYDFARVISVKGTNAEMDKGRLRLQAAVNEDVLKRLQIGFVSSDETAPWVFDIGHGEALTAWLKHKGYIK